MSRIKPLFKPVIEEICMCGTLQVLYHTIVDFDEQRMLETAVVKEWGLKNMSESLVCFQNL